MTVISHMLKGAMLSPLEGVSNCAFRRLCFQLGASFTWTEMIRAAAVHRNNASALDLIDTYDPSTPTGLQLMAKSTDELVGALNHLQILAATTRPHFRNIRAIDINLGCPSPDIIRVGGGPALLKRRAKLQGMFEALVAWKETNTLGVSAVGCKIRLGLNCQEQEQKVYLRVVESANSSGLDYLTVHARHAKQRSRDLPTWSSIQEIKQLARMPIIGNGDIFTSQLADQMQGETGCDGIMIARAAIYNPWVFRSFTSRTGSFDHHPSTPTLEEIEGAEREYLSYVHADNDDDNALPRRHDNADNKGTESQMGAKASRTKPKYLAFHQQNFARMKQQLLATTPSQPQTQSPRNQQKQQQQQMMTFFPNTIHLQ